MNSLAHEQHPPWTASPWTASPWTASPMNSVPHEQHPPSEWDICYSWWTYIDTSSSPKSHSSYYSSLLVLNIPWAWTNVYAPSIIQRRFMVIKFLCAPLLGFWKFVNPKTFLKRGKEICACSRAVPGGPWKEVLPMRERKVGLLCERLGDLPKYTSLLRIIFFPRGIVVRGQVG